MHGRVRYLAPCVAALLLGSTTGLADGASAPDATLSALESAKRSAVLELYALESSLARARAKVAENARQERELESAQADALVRASIVRRSLAATQRRIATLLRRLYVEGSPEPVEVLLGARSLPAVLEGIDGLERSARLNRGRCIQTVMTAPSDRHSPRQAVRGSGSATRNSPIWPFSTSKTR